MLPHVATALLSLVSLIATAAWCRAENWPQWRGPRLDGASSETNLPVKWSKTENIAWRTPLPGPAGATPVVWEDRIFLTSVDDQGRLLLICIGTDGKPQWQQTVTQGNTDVRGDEGNSASPSPCTDGQHVWTLMGNGVLACFSVDGKPAWKLNLQDRYGSLNLQFGLTSTPVLNSGRLYLQLIHGDGRAETQEALLVALDAASGKEIWRQERVTGASQENEHSYSSPTIYRDEQLEFLVTHGGDYVSAHRLNDGSELWRYCLNPKGNLYHPTLRFVASPLATDGFVIAPSAKNGPIVSIDVNARGEVQDGSDAVRWRRDKGTPDVPSPLYHGGLVYLCRENGNLVCIDAQSGETIYEERTTADRHRASPVIADGKIYLTARKGVVSVVRAGREFELLAQNDLGEPISSSPVISNGRIYIRTFDALYAVGKPATERH